MFDRFHSEIDVQVRPVQVMRARQLDVRDLSDGSLAEPREFLERHEQFALSNE
jgi:hypothetical protein